MAINLFASQVSWNDLPITLSIEFEDAGAGTPRLRFAMSYHKGGAVVTHVKDADLSETDGLQSGTFSYDSLDRSITLQVLLDQAWKDRIKVNGLAGAAFTRKAELHALKVVLRPRPAGGDWSSEHPAFALIACWNLQASAVAGKGDALEAAVTASFETCIGLSVITPGEIDLGLPNIQFRLDLPPLGLTTNWRPFSWIEWPGIDPLSMEGLLAWFARLLEFNWDIPLPGVTPPRLPSWDIDFPIEIDLPLGVGVRETRLRVQQGDDGALLVDALARGFYLTWNEQAVTQPYGMAELHYDAAADVCNAKFVLFEAQHPDPAGAGPATPIAISLPFDLLGAEAECFYLSAGFHFPNVLGGIQKACFEALLEIGGLRITSRFTGANSGGLYRTDVRLLLRDTTLITAPAPAAARLFTSARRPPGNDPFARWDNAQLPALSFGQDLLAPPSAPGDNEYGFEILDGDFRPGERAYLLWSMSSERLMKALAHDLLGREPAGAVSARERKTFYALEIATHPEEGSTQVRLEWRPAVPEPLALLPDSNAPAAVATKCFKVDPARDIAFNVPLASPGTHLDGPFASAGVLDLPAISLEMARPASQSIVLRAEADGRHSVSHLLLFDALPQVAAGTAVSPLLRARVGFSLKKQGSDSDRREVVETEAALNAPRKDDPFLTLGIGSAQPKAVAIRSIGWRRGHAPRFLEVLQPGTSPITPLIPRTVPAAQTGDPGCPGAPTAKLPPAALPFDAFGTPRFEADGWRLSARISAASALFKMFKSAGGGAEQKVGFSIEEICIDEADDRIVLLKTKVEFKLGSGPDAFNADGAVAFRFDLRDLSLSVADGASLAFRLPRDTKGTPAWTSEAPLPKPANKYDYSKEIKLLGLEMTALAPKPEAPANAATPVKPPDTIDVLTLSIDEGRFMLALPPERAIVLRYTGLGRGSLNFWITQFVLGPGGLDATGKLMSSALTVKGLSHPFMLEQASLRIRASRLEYLSVSGSGVLPELLDEAPVKIGMTFKQEANGSIDLDELHAHLGDKGKPIFSRGTRFKFEIEELGLAYRRAPGGGERHFFFELTGSAQFTPDEGEFASGLLENLKSARVDFVRVPLTDEFAEYITFSIELKTPVVFKVFGVFRMEIRSIGFAPKFAKFKAPRPAVIIGGQVEFADVGDVVRAEIDFHAMYIGLPAAGSSLPQVYFDGLRVDISTAEGFRIGGRVDTYKSDTLDGFAGEGTLQIPALPELSAAFAFVRVRTSPDVAWKRAWFIAVEAAKISYPVGGALPIFLRQIGMGFGFRYTLPIVLTFKEHRQLGELIKAMLAEVGKHETLARIDSWTQDAGSDDWTIALEALLSLGSANTTPVQYNELAERQIRTVFTQIFAAFRSDFTLVAAAKLWFPVSVDDFFRNRSGMRQRPLASGFFAFSAPQNRLLAHFKKSQDPYMGDEANLPMPSALKLALEKSYFEATLLVEPGLVHAELGWPDRLGFELNAGPLKVGCRGGVLMRIERDLLIYGYYFTAYGQLALGGAVDLGFVGVRIEALVRVQYATRLLIGTNLRKPLDSNLYGAIGLDIAVRFQARAWLRLNFRFFSIKSDLSFSFSLQLSVLGEIGWAGQGEIGFRGRARLTISVFGRSLGIAIDVGINQGAIEKARKALSSYAGSFLEPGKAPLLIPGLDDGFGGPVAPVQLDTAIGTTSPAVHPVAGAAIGTTPLVESPAAAGAPPAPSVPTPVPTSVVGDAFVTACVAGEQAPVDGKKLFFVWIMPGPNGERFYVPVVSSTHPPEIWVDYATLTIPMPGPMDEVFVLKDGAWDKINPAEGLEAKLRLNIAAEVTLSAESAGAESRSLTLPQLIAGCYKPDFAAGAPEEDREEFPWNWPKVRPKSFATTGALKAGERLQDDRVFDQADPARGPRRELDQGNAFDRVMLGSRTIETVGGTQKSAKDDLYFADQAFAHQSLLLQGFHDDLVRIAGTTRVIGPVGTRTLHTPSLGGGRPRLTDIGMLLCVLTDEMPSWLARRGGSVFPTLHFTGTPTADVHELKPAADADRIDFGLNPPLVKEAAAYFDEEVAALAWELEWAGGEPGQGQLADGASRQIEDYVRAYEIAILDFDTQRSVHSATVMPSAVCARPSHLDGRHEAGGSCQEAGDQRCGSNSSMRLAWCVGNRSSTSLKYA